MKFLEILAFLPIVLIFVLGANVASERTQTASVDATPLTQTDSIYPFMAIALLIVFVLSGLFFMAREMRREEREKRNRD